MRGALRNCNGAKTYKPGIIKPTIPFEIQCSHFGQLEKEYYIISSYVSHILARGFF